MKNAYNFYSDSAHGWLAVPKKYLDELNVSEKISSWSYMNGKTVYLEEDCDATIFLNAYKEHFGDEAKINFIDHKNHSIIRGYRSYDGFVKPDKDKKNCIDVLRNEKWEEYIALEKDAKDMEQVCKIISDCFNCQVRWQYR